MPAHSKKVSKGKTWPAQHNANDKERNVKKKCSRECEGRNVIAFVLNRKRATNMFALKHALRKANQETKAYKKKRKPESNRQELAPRENGSPFNKSQKNCKPANENGKPVKHPLGMKGASAKLI
jgi:hypothetical protein